MGVKGRPIGSLIYIEGIVPWLESVGNDITKNRFINIRYFNSEYRSAPAVPIPILLILNNEGTACKGTLSNHEDSSHVYEVKRWDLQSDCQT